MPMVLSVAGPQHDPIKIIEPMEAEVIDAVRALDGETTTEIFLHPDENETSTYLAIAGGVDDQYLVFICHNNERFTEATTPDATGADFEMVIGGQPGHYHPSQLVDLDQAIAAAREYHRSSSPAPTVNWETR